LVQVAVQERTQQTRLQQPLCETVETAKLQAFRGARIHSRAMVVSVVKLTGLTTNVVVLAGQTPQPLEAPEVVRAAQHQQVALVALTDPIQASMHHQAVRVTATASLVS
jgi:AmiR/NasT family two-component response regulator